MIKLHPEILSKKGKKEFAVLPYEEFLALQEMLADAEDLLDLRAAKKKESSKKGVDIETVKKKLLK